MKAKRLFVDVPENFHREVKLYAVKNGLALKELIVVALKNQISKDIERESNGV